MRTVRGVVWLAVIAATSIQASSVGLHAQVSNPFVGTWKLISIETRGTDGAPLPGPNPVGGVNPTGTVMYDAAGHVSLQIMPGGRSRRSTPCNRSRRSRPKRPFSDMSRITARTRWISVRA